MKRTALSFDHVQKGKPGSPISFLFPDPQPQGKVNLTKSEVHEKDWQMAMLEAIGIGRCLSFRHYAVKEPTTFCSWVSEPVVCLRIQIENESYNGYEKENVSPSLSFEDECRLFWQGDRVTESHLLPGEHTLLDLFFRPECLSPLADRSPVGEILDTAASEAFGKMGHHRFMADKEVERFLKEMMEEIGTGSPTNERFHYLCDCLVLMCLGEEVDVEPPPASTGEEDDEPSVHNGSREYLPSSTEEMILSELEGMDRKDLLERFWPLYRQVHELERNWRSENELSKTVEKTALVIQKAANTRLSEVYMDAARFLADRYKKGKASPKQKTLIKRAVARCCKHAFGLRRPNLWEMDFYTRWAGCPYVSEAIEIDRIEDLLSMFLPSDAPDFSGVDETLQGRELLVEQLWESFGFRSMSDFTGQTEKDKPKEVVELYRKLMGHFYETLDIGDGSGIQRSDIVRELDCAYEHNELLTLYQLEVSHLAQAPGYVDSQGEERLRWFIVALRFDQENFSGLLREFEENADYSDLRLFHSLGNDMDRLRKAIRERSKGLEEKADVLKAELASTQTVPETDRVIALAKRILIPSKKRQ